MKNKISIIIPAYYDENITIKNVKDLINITKNIELIIVYKGNRFSYLKEKIDIFDIDIKLIEFLGVSTRSKLMNLGAKNTNGDILLFLHNDTILPKSYHEILSNLDITKYNYGGFYKQFLPNNLLLEINSFITNIRVKYFGSLLGDNSIFVTRELFFKIGGFPEISLMEDVEISKKLNKSGKIFIIKNKTITSSVKFLKNGTTKTLIFMLYLRILYKLGVKTELIKEKYSRL
ncbi:MAG: glycosyltransferase [Candidatus Gracilibacteria bacterium]|nr:glycosyltransferase [Candidatus Gracilibacteria bacterium]